ncbi:MAG: hypothetical protein ACLQJR_35740 [Stellaceae bacterium]
MVSWRMPVSDDEITRAAHQWIQKHGDLAIAMAREMVEAMRRRGDHDGADTWLRIIVAIGELGAPPTDTRH